MSNRSFLLIGVIFLCLHRAFGLSELIVNGGFESNSPAPWHITGTGAAVSSNGVPFEGTKFLVMGAANNAVQGVYQTVTFPTNLIAATLTFYYSNFTSDLNSTEDALLLAYITDTNQSVLATALRRSNLNPTTSYVKASYPLVTYTGDTNLSAYAGKTVEVYFFANTAQFTGVFTVFSIDAVSLLAATPADIPANDTFTNRTAFTASSITIAATNDLALKETGEPNHAGNSGGRSLWWTWTAPGSGVVNINMNGSSFQTLLAVYTGSELTNLTSVASNDGNNGRDNSTHVSFKASQGLTYAIAVDGYNGASGNIVLNFNFTADTTVPKVAITSPASGAKLTNSTVVVRGTATDNIAVGAVEYRLENSAGTNAYQAASGTNSWTATVTDLIPGMNTIRVRAFDTSSNF
jgi:hypothetical protein